MKKNVFKFRRLKWGDPEEKFKMLPEDTAPRECGDRRSQPAIASMLNDKMLVGVAVALVVLAALLSF
ncbi:hypothetical protein [Pelagibacterium halotolerans]|uniref:hypothetical protein n=1 Tax=Pelagibacterium halotolerans TaxID=531813 RepID=UPI00384F278F